MLRASCSLVTAAACANAVDNRCQNTEGHGLKLSFKTRDLRLTCSDPDFALRNLGPDLAESLQARLADLDAADHLTDVPLGIDLARSTLAYIPIHVLTNHYLIGRADHVKIWGNTDSEIPWDKVSRIQLTQIQEMPR